MYYVEFLVFRSLLFCFNILDRVLLFVFNCCMYSNLAQCTNYCQFLMYKLLYLTIFG